MRAAYKGNPTLDAERARLRAVDEDVQRARAGWGPRIQAQASMGITDTRTRGQPRDLERSKDVGVQLTQPLFTGFRTYNAVNQAEADVRAARARLRDIESEILEDVAEAYFNVARDRTLITLSTKTYGIFNRELALARTRLAVGEVTTTDVDQARSRRAEAKVVIEQFKGDLHTSEATYRRLVGRSPRKVTITGSIFGKLPGQLSAAIAVARRESPLVERALYREQSARFAVSRERSELLPRVDLEAGYTHAYSNNGTTTRTDTTAVIGRLLVPLYQGGGQRARIRQAKHIHVSLLQEIEEARRNAVDRVRRAWAALRASQAKIRSDRLRISAAKSALRGVRGEEKVGQRTVLDVLNAEEDVFDAQSSLIGNRRDAAFAHYQVLRGIGRLDASFLRLAKKQYDPEIHYKEARGKWFTTAITQQEPSPTGKPGGWGSSVTASKLGGPIPKTIAQPVTPKMTRSRLQVRRKMRRRKSVTKRTSRRPTRRIARRATARTKTRRQSSAPTSLALRGRVEPAKLPDTRLGQN